MKTKQPNQYNITQTKDSYFLQETLKSLFTYLFSHSIRLNDKNVINI